LIAEVDSEAPQFRNSDLAGIRGEATASEKLFQVADQGWYDRDAVGTLTFTPSR